MRPRQSNVTSAADDATVFSCTVRGKRCARLPPILTIFRRLAIPIFVNCALKRAAQIFFLRKRVLLSVSMIRLHKLQPECMHNSIVTAGLAGRHVYLYVRYCRDRCNREYVPFILFCLFSLFNVSLASRVKLSAAGSVWSADGYGVNCVSRQPLSLNPLCRCRSS